MQTVNFNPEIGKLLAESQLPFDDLIDTDKVTLYSHERDGQIVGLVGLEFHGDEILLRSLVIAASERGVGLGAKLVSYAEKKAIASGAKSIYLLTTTANQFFKRLGYSAINRTEAPESIASTAQFSDLCPSSADFMVKRFDG